MSEQMPEGMNGPPSWWMVWGEIRAQFADLRSVTLANRQHTHDLVQALQRRQDDMRRETIYHISHLHHRLEALQPDAKPKPEGFLHSITQKVTLHAFMTLVSWAASILGVLGFLKPEWVRILTGH